MTTRNSNAHFALAPQVAIERSTFDRSCTVKTSWDVGQLIPFYCDEIYPGDSVRIETSKAVRLQTLITPVMDNLYLDTYYFFVPNRLVWDHWEQLIGATDGNPWIPSVEYTVPKMILPSGGFNVGTLGDYFGIPVGRDSGTKPVINHLPFRAYCKIVNDWFRDENLQDMLFLSTTDTNVQANNLGEPFYGGKPFVACKFHDYFTSCLPSAQRSEYPVSFLPEYLPVVTRNNYAASGVHPDMKLSLSTGMSITGNHNIGTYHGNTVQYDSTTTGSGSGVYPTNLWASSWLQTASQNGSNFYPHTGLYPGTTINDLRQAFQIQRLLEKDARTGIRYIEIIEGHFGVTSPDARLQRSEYLGGNRVPFNIEQVLQTSSTDSTTPQGNTAGWSLTNDVSYDVDKSFTEHGYIIGLMCARYDHSYQQGMERHWFRDRRFSYYWPSLAHLGEQAVYEKEICFTGDEVYDDMVFGYQEAWADLRYKPNYITGQLRSEYTQSLDFWHFGDYYDILENPDNVPRLSAEWIQEDKENVDRCLAVTSRLANQIFGDIMINAKFTRPMPLYSIPGLVDHF